MSQPLKSALLNNAFAWFRTHFRQALVAPVESHFPNFALPDEIGAVLARTDGLLGIVKRHGESRIATEWLETEIAKLGPRHSPLFRQIILRYRRHRAAETERLTEKTFHRELTDALEEEVKALDVLVDQEWFQRIEPLRLPRLKDFLPVQYVEAATANSLPLPARQHDEKFHVLQAPNLFLPDLAYFRAKCEDRETPVALAFLDIDDFKKFNTAHTETKIDRNMLPRFMQALEAHVFHHGFAYRQGGDEYLILLPSLSKPLAIAFLDELRQKLADLRYPEIEGGATVSIGLCIVDSDCVLTDRELLDRASYAKKYAKEHGKNCIASYFGPRFLDQALQIVAPPRVPSPL